MSLPQPPHIERATATIRAAAAEFGPGLVVVTSFQREGMVILDLALKTLGAIRVLTLDTGRLPAATVSLMDEVESFYGISIERIRPDEAELSAMVETHGRDLFYDGVPQRTLCCNIRKVRPLAKALKSVGAYFTGLRREQSESRREIEVFDRSSSPVKISPLADWTAAEVLEYTHANNIPEHALYAAGYTSIGCDPCTRPTTEGEDERAGRWWWENDGSRECGLHFSPDGRVERTVDVLLREILQMAHPAQITI
jgi:phosphoadenosine phosphosulfate reductase